MLSLPCRMLSLLMSLSTALVTHTSHHGLVQQCSKPDAHKPDAPQVWLAAPLGRQTNTGVRSTRLTTHKSHAIRVTELCAAPPRTLQSQRPHFKPRHTCEGIACDIPEEPEHKASQRASKAPRTTLSKKHPAGRRRLRHAQSRVANEAQGTTQARRHQRRGLITTPRMEAPPRVG